MLFSFLFFLSNMYPFLFLSTLLSMATAKPLLDRYLNPSGEICGLYYFSVCEQPLNSTDNYFASGNSAEFDAIDPGCQTFRSSESAGDVNIRDLGYISASNKYCPVKPKLSPNTNSRPTTPKFPSIELPQIRQQDFNPASEKWDGVCSDLDKPIATCCNGLFRVKPGDHYNDCVRCTLGHHYFLDIGITRFAVARHGISRS